jgi:hypothetical protein
MRLGWCEDDRSEGKVGELQRRRGDSAQGGSAMMRRILFLPVTSRKQNLPDTLQNFAKNSTHETSTTLRVLGGF